MGNIITNVLVNNDRQKIYQSQEGIGRIYLNGGTEFKIEFISKSTEVTGLKVKINGKYLSNRFIALKPGERFVLDSFIEEQRKLKYEEYSLASINDEHYNVSEDSYMSSKASLIEIEEYTEMYLNNNLSFKTTSYNESMNIVSNFIDLNQTFGGNLPGNLGGSLSNIDKSTKKTDCNKKGSFISKGSTSNQKLIKNDYEFNLYPIFTTSIMLLNISHKPIESKDFKKYCTNCGKKISPKNNFCGNCGTKI